jgi:hypothetical protein
LIPIRQEKGITCGEKDEREEKVSKRKGIRASNRPDNDEEIESTRARVYSRLEAQETTTKRKRKEEQEKKQQLFRSTKP